MTVVQVALELGFACDHVDLLRLKIRFLSVFIPALCGGTFFFVGREELLQIKVSALPNFIKMSVLICLVLV